MQEALQVSERRVCGATGWGRSGLRYRVRSSAEGQRLVERMRALAQAHPRFGYRRVWALLRAEGWRAAARAGYTSSPGRRGRTATLRDELLEREEFASVLEARVVSEARREEYNAVRPHCALGYRTPAEYGASCPRSDSAKPRPNRGHDGRNGNG